MNSSNPSIPALSSPESTLPRQPADVKQTAGRGRRERRQQLVSLLSAILKLVSSDRAEPVEPHLCLSRFSFQLTVEMFDYLECELNLFLSGKLFRPDSQSEVTSLKVQSRLKIDCWHVAKGSEGVPECVSHFRNELGERLKRATSATRKRGTVLFVFHLHRL